MEWLKNNGYAELVKPVETFGFDGEAVLCLKKAKAVQEALELPSNKRGLCAKFLAQLQLLSSDSSASSPRFHNTHSAPTTPRSAVPTLTQGSEAVQGNTGAPSSLVALFTPLPALSSVAVPASGSPSPRGETTTTTIHQVSSFPVTFEFWVFFFLTPVLVKEERK